MRNLSRMVRFAEVFPDEQIVSATRTQLGWTHFRQLIALDDPLERDFYAEMRYDIWDELLKPMLLDRMEILADLPGSSILPSETQLTRKAISAGLFPESFDKSTAEDRLLKPALAKEFGYTGDVEVVTPEGSGTGETVRYQAGNLAVYIFELCDKELHHIKTKKRFDSSSIRTRSNCRSISRSLAKFICLNWSMKRTRRLRVF